MVRVGIAGALALVALTSVAAAQKMPAAEPLREDRPQFDERKYRAATQSVPEAQRSNDPWAGAREPTPPAGAAATSTPASGKQRNTR